MSEIGARKVRAIEIGLRQFGAHRNHALIGGVGPEIRPNELRVAKIHAASAANDPRIGKIGAAEIGAVEKRGVKGRGLQQGPREIYVLQISAREIRPGEIGLCELCTCEPGRKEIRAM